jgi:hypothetical protein
MSERTIVGINPVLPWPLSGWEWWTRPVRAESLAVLRIALAALLLIDLLGTYLPQVHDFFGQGTLGSPEIWDYLARAPKWNWSLLRGFQDPLLMTMAQVVWICSTGLLVLGLWGRLSAAPEGRRQPVLGWALAAWTFATVVGVLGLWARIGPNARDGESLVWRIPLIALGIAALFWCLIVWRRLAVEPDEDDPILWRWALVAMTVSGALAAVGLWRHLAPWRETPIWLRWTEVPWHGDAAVLKGAMLVLVAATVLMLLGLCTRLAAVLVWLLSMSFSNLNWYIDNAGDQVRVISLFYLMLAPCGAAWSLDSWWARRRGRLTGPVYIHPWALRLLFVQMALIYFCNGVYKAAGSDWHEGSSLYYVWCNLTLTRFSITQLPVPYWVTQWMTWTVMVWELAFPLLVVVKWTRVPALLLGVSFHLGIFATMEIGGFAPYMLVLYLPLLPWDRWLSDDRGTTTTGSGRAAGRAG